MKRLVLRPDSFLGRLVQAGRKLSRLLVIVVLLIFLVQLGSFLAAYLFPRMTAADWGTVEHGGWVKALALREEILLVAPVEGKVRFLVTGKTKVQKDQALAEVANPVLEQEMKGDWREIFRVVSERLYRLDRELALIEQDVAFVTGQIAKTTRQTEGRQNNLRELELARDRLAFARQEVIQETNSQTIPGWQDYYRLVRAEQAGIFTADTDGWEEIALSDLQKEETNPFQLRYSSSEVYSGRLVKKGDPLGKIVTGTGQILLVEPPGKGEISPLERGAVCRLRMGEEEHPLTFTGSCVIGGEELWLLEEKSFLPELLEKRIFNTYLIYRRTAGVRVPRSALHYNEETGWKVYTSSQGIKKAIPVELVDKDDRWAIVKNLNFGTSVLFRGY